MTNTTGAVTLTQRVAAPPETVFSFLVDPEKVLRWMGTSIDIEPEPGGRFSMNANGTDVASGHYVAVEPPHRVVFTWGWEGSTDVPPGSSTVTFTLTPDGDHTVVELTHADLPGGESDQHIEGWTFFIKRLALVAEGRDPGPDMHAPTHEKEDS